MMLRHTRHRPIVAAQDEMLKPRGLHITLTAASGPRQSDGTFTCTVAALFWPGEVASPGLPWVAAAVSGYSAGNGLLGALNRRRAAALSRMRGYCQRNLETISCTK